MALWRVVDLGGGGGGGVCSVVVVLGWMRGGGRVVGVFGGSSAPVSSSSHGVRVVMRFQWGLVEVVRKAWVKAWSWSIGRSMHSVVSSMSVGLARREGSVAGVFCPHARMKATIDLLAVGSGGVCRDGTMVTMKPTVWSERSRVRWPRHRRRTQGSVGVGPPGEGSVGASGGSGWSPVGLP